VNEPRFYVATVDGYMGETSHRPGSRGLSAHVLDRAFNCAVVKTFRSETCYRKRGTIAERDGVKRAEELAERWAHYLNEADE
jgi:hypothetical protein